MRKYNISVINSNTGTDVFHIPAEIVIATVADAA